MRRPLLHAALALTLTLLGCGGALPGTQDSGGGPMPDLHPPAMPDLLPAATPDLAPPLSCSSNTDCTAKSSACCNGACVDLTRDGNCGACGVRCPAGSPLCKSDGSGCGECSSNGDCANVAACSGGVCFCNALGACTRKAELGVACRGDGDCLGGACVDGVCCDTPAASCGGCRACNVAGHTGHCTNVPSGADPHDTCTADAANCRGDNCGGDGTCNLPNGTSCDVGSYCSGGVCGPCVAGVSCASNPSAPCTAGISACTSGTFVCHDDGPAKGGVACGTNEVCDGSGHCISCTAGSACSSNPGGVCFNGVTSCDTGGLTCVDDGPAAGTTCGSNEVCDGSGSCVNCAAGEFCNTNPTVCYAGVTDCSTGQLVCNDTTTALVQGTTCGLLLACDFTHQCSTTLPPLVAQWTMDDAVGSTTAADSSGNGVDAVANGPVTFVPGGGVTGAPGDGALRLDGTGYLVATFPNDAAGDGSGDAIPNQNVTFTMWVKTATPASVPGGLQVLTDTDNVCDRVIGNGDSAELDYSVYGNQGDVIGTGNAHIADGAWHQVVLVLDTNNGTQLFIDGVLDSVTNDGTDCGEGCSDLATAVNYFIGTSLGCHFDAANFTGDIDDVRIYAGNFSPDQVAQLYAQDRPTTLVQILEDCGFGTPLLNTFSSRDGKSCYTPITAGGASWIHFLTPGTATLWQGSNCTGCSRRVWDDVNFCSDYFDEGGTKCEATLMNDQVFSVSFP